TLASQRQEVSAHGVRHQFSGVMLERQEFQADAEHALVWRVDKFFEYCLERRETSRLEQASHARRANFQLDTRNQCCAIRQFVAIRLPPASRVVVVPAWVDTFGDNLLREQKDIELRPFG